MREWDDWAKKVNSKIDSFTKLFQDNAKTLDEIK